MHPNEELARREFDVLNPGDLDALAGRYVDDFVLHYPGRNPRSGEHRSFGAFLEKIRGPVGDDGSVDSLGS